VRACVTVFCPAGRMNTAFRKRYFLQERETATKRECVHVYVFVCECVCARVRDDFSPSGSYEQGSYRVAKTRRIS